jgi:hypothetical protein
MAVLGGICGGGESETAEGAGGGAEVVLGRVAGRVADSEDKAIAA